MEEVKIGTEAFRGDVEIGTELGTQEVAEGAPWFFGVPITNVNAFVTERFDEFIYSGGEAFRSRVRG